MSRHEMCSKCKNRRTVAVKEAVIVLGRERGITNREFAEALGIGPSAVTRRAEAARSRKAASLEAIDLRELLSSKLRP